MIVRMKNTFRMLLAAMLLSLFALPGYSWQKSFPDPPYRICIPSGKRLPPIPDHYPPSLG